MTVVDAINTNFSSGDHLLTDDGCRERRGLQGLCGQLDALCAAADRGDITSVDVHYQRLMEEPEQTVLDAWQALGLPASAGLAERIAGFLRDQAAGKRAKPPKAYDDFGYDHDGVLGEASVRRYLERFAVPHERSRVSATRVER